MRILLTHRLAFAAGALLLAGAAPLGAQSALRFRPIVPCRVVDTRTAAGQGPILVTNTDLGLTAAVTRFFRVRQFEACVASAAIPPSAQAISYNLTVVGPTHAGHLTVYPSHLSAAPNTSSLNFTAPVVLANGGIVSLNLSTTAGHDVAVRLVTVGDPGSEAHVLLDVTGYFEQP